MLVKRHFREFTSRKLWYSRRNLSLVFLFCLIASSLELVISSEFLHGLDEVPVNPGIGVKYYESQNTNRKTLLSLFEIFRMASDFVPRDCSKAPKSRSCIQQNLFYQDPAFLYQLLHQVPCNMSNPYRNYNGTCIGPLASVLGMARDCYFRFVPQYYEGYGGFRKSVDGSPLPEPRDISLKIFKDLHNPELKLSFQFLIFGQLIAHDMSRSVQPQIDCCSPANAGKEECAPISVRSNDPFYSQFNKTCIDFQRSEVCTLDKTKNREQRNGATAALDASFMYGVSESKANKLRTFDGTGRLKSTDTKRFSILPSGKDPEDIFCPKNQEFKCFLAGDYRVNQHSVLTSFHTLWMREHNRLATALKRINPHWKEEQLFQEARKLVIAEIQCITYQDFLPILLTPRIMKEFDLTIKKGSAGSWYNPLAVIAIWHDWAVAAFRLHSGVPSNIGSLNLRFKDTFSNPDLIRHGYMSDLIKGTHKVGNEKLDLYMIEDLTNYLYKMPGVPYGKDLTAINIQRGRDHGIAPYVEIVKFCSERTINIKSFKDLVEKRIMSPRNVELLKQIYRSVKDVDMWVGMQLENKTPGSILGPSAVCVNAKQFYFTQKGDRLFFNHKGLFSTFTTDKRIAIKNTSLGRILCDNTDIDRLSNNTFLLPSDDNPMVSCKDIPKIDLSVWKETPN